MNSNYEVGQIVKARLFIGAPWKKVVVKRVERDEIEVEYIEMPSIQIIQKESFCRLITHDLTRYISIG